MFKARALTTQVSSHFLTYILKDLFMCMHVLPAWMSVYHMGMVFTEVRRGTQSGTRVIYGYKPSCRSLEPISGLQEQVFLTAEPFFPDSPPSKSIFQFTVPKAMGCFAPRCLSCLETLSICGSSLLSSCSDAVFLLQSDFSSVCLGWATTDTLCSLQGWNTSSC